MKKGSTVLLKRPEEIKEEFKDKINSTEESYVFENLDLNIEQINAICPEIEYKILYIDSDGDIKFYNLPGTYPQEVIKEIINE